MYDTHEAVSILFASAHKPQVFLCVLAHSNGRQLLSSFAKLRSKECGNRQDKYSWHREKSAQRLLHHNFAHKDRVGV